MTSIAKLSRKRPLQTLQNPMAPIPGPMAAGGDYTATMWILILRGSHKAMSPRFETVHAAGKIHCFVCIVKSAKSGNYSPHRDLDFITLHVGGSKCKWAL